MDITPCETAATEQMSMYEWKQSISHHRGAKYLQQIRKRIRLPEHMSIRNLQDVQNERILHSFFTDAEIKGMMMLYHYLHPEETPQIEGKEAIIAVLNDYRRMIKIRMSPVAYQYLLNPFDDALSSSQLQEAMGEEQLWGAVHLLNFLCPTELNDDDMEGSSSPTSSSLRNMLAILRQSRLNREREERGESSSGSDSGLTTAGGQRRQPRAFILYHGDQQLLIIT